MKEDVIKRINEVVRNEKIRKKLIDKINNDQDLTQEESHLIYRRLNFDKDVPLTKKKELNIDWTDHAKYRSELRDIDPQMINQGIKKRLKKMFIYKKDSKGSQRFEKMPGTAVVKYNLKPNQEAADSKADVITVWAALFNEEKGRNVMSEIKFACKNEALQYLSDFTNSKIIIAKNYLSANIRKSINNLLTDIGATYHESVPLNEISNILKDHEIVMLQEDNTEFKGMLLGENSRASLSLSSKDLYNKESKQYTPYDNSNLILTWYKMPTTGNFEVVAYLS